MKMINYLLKFVSIIIGVIVGVNQISTSTALGDILISFSLIIIVFIPDILAKFDLKITPSMNLIYLLFILLAQTLGSVLDFYQIFGFYDKIVHFLSGVLTSFIGLYILLNFNKYDKKNLSFNIIFIIFSVMAIASFWEFFEFTSNILFGGDAQKVLLTGVNDTMTDMLSAFLGSIVFSCMYVFEIKLKKDLIINRFIKELK